VIGSTHLLLEPGDTHSDLPLHAENDNAERSESANRLMTAERRARGVTPCSDSSCQHQDDGQPKKSDAQLDYCISFPEATTDSI